MFASNAPAKMLSALLLLSTYFISTAHATEGCRPLTQGTKGFDLSLYHYPFSDMTAGAGKCYSNDYQTTEYQQGGYATFGGGLFGTAEGIEDLSLDIKLNSHCRPVKGDLPSNYNYAEQIDVSNFTMLLTGYFMPQETGKYTFTLYADDLAYMSFGAGNAFDCCGMEESVSDPEAFDLIVIWKSNDNYSGQVSYTLEGGVYYPLRILFANRDYHSFLKLTFEDPNGNVYTDFTNHIFQFPDEADGCPNNIKETTTVWSETYTSTTATSVYITTGTDGIVTTETLYVIATPEEKTHTQTATTVYSTGTVTETTTVSTATGVYTGTDGIITTETTYFIEEPSTGTTVSTATTVYSTGTVTEVTTVSTATGVYTGTDGVVTTETTYFIEEPSTQESETNAVFTTSVWPALPTISVSFPDGGMHTVIVPSVTMPTTYTTVVTYETTDSDGNTEELTATDTIIEIPEPETSSDVPEPETTITTEKTTTEFGSVTAPTTETHVTTYTTTDDDGDEEEIIETDIVIEEPEPETTITTAETTTEFGSVTSPTTKTHVTTYYTTNSDGEEEEIIETDVEVELPSVGETVSTSTTVYTVGTGTETTTVATKVTTYYTTNSNGEEEEVIETEYVVEIPDVETTITTAVTETSAYPGTVTTTVTHVTTYLTTDSNGNEEEIVETEVIVEIPEQTAEPEDEEGVTVTEHVTQPQDEKTISTTSTINSYYTGSQITTYSTNIRTYTTTDANGNPEEVIETDYYVLIPQSTAEDAHVQTEVQQVTKESNTAVSQQTVTSSKSSTTANVSEYHGVGTSMTNNLFTFVMGLLFTTLFM
ncbi:hypothetical protein DAKH74_017420 [Maudiozyma humilis]|uniref:PA14 domain-containing protein n=1 Tax=Maudiozyma humilis TaxID=51915 RepID=A0AAV5RUA9_MAUHU|nr:hypothetical protein DAKH74_017420 [Kazachstania humilis]